MGEVSAKVVDDTIAHLRGAGIDVESLLRGLPIARDPHGAIAVPVPWDAYVSLLERAQAAFGGREAAIRAAESHALNRPSWRDLLATFSDPGDFLALVWRTLIPNLYPHLEIRYESEPARAARLALSVPEPYRSSDAFLDGCLGLARGLLRLVGAGADGLLCVWLSRGWMLTFTLPAPRRADDGASALPAAEPSAAEPFAAGPLAAEPFAAGDSVEALAEALVQTLVTRCGARQVALWLTDGDGALRPLREPGPGFVAVHARELRAGGRVVGRVAIDVVDGDGDAAGVLDHVLPWAAAALEGARRAAGADAHRAAAERESRARERSEAALRAATETLPGPAYMVDPLGRVEAANSAGQTELARDAGGVEALLREVVAGRSDGHAWEVHPLPRGPLAGHRLVIRRDVAREVERRMGTVARAWGLTARQQEVLGQLVRGRTNKEVAQELGCADNTVEFHVTQLLRKAGVENRSALVAAFWAGG